MKIAIVAPSGVPFAIGGAENLWWGLLTHINQATCHQAELIKLPTPEHTLFDVAAGYERFNALNLDHFDLVISTKYPAWMVRHPNHICYVQHTLRGLYDTYPCKIKQMPRIPGLGRLQKIIGSTPDENTLGELFTLIDKASRNPVVKAGFVFPGPLSRSIVHYLDRVALDPGRIRRHLAISANVAGRKDYFPAGVSVNIVHHPSNLRGLHCTGYDYIFTASRLDSPKRLDLLIKAYKQVATDIPLKIAGTGPHDQKLREIAGEDRRIEFLGFVTDSQLVDLYARALFVPYMPYDEDYGLITVEAMKSSKAVLTTTDAGGVNEFVRHKHNGLCVSPTVAEVAKGIETLISDKKATIAMGENALAGVASISWENTVSALLASGGKSEPRIYQVPRRPKIVVVSTFAVFPPVGGGQRRIYHVYKELSRKADVVVVSLVPPGGDKQELRLDDNLLEIQIPQTRTFRLLVRMLEKKVGISVEDIAAIQGFEKIPQFKEELARQAEQADVLVASHPYLYFALAGFNKPVWYDAHNVEYDLKTGMLGKKGPKLAESVFEVEKECARASSFVLACSKEDAGRLQTLYGIDENRLSIVPNGVDTSRVAFVDGAARKQNKARLGWENVTTCLFIGSLHQPNEQGLLALGGIAARLASVLFLVAGSVCRSVHARGLPANVKLLDLVTEKEKQVLLHGVDLGLNPIDSGSGTNLKLLEYAAAGLPALSTPFGTRGTGFDADHVFVARLADWDAVIPEIIGDETALDEATRRARSLVEKRFSWRAVGQKLLGDLDRMLEANAQQR